MGKFIKNRKIRWKERQECGPRGKSGPAAALPRLEYGLLLRTRRDSGPTNCCGQSGGQRGGEAALTLQEEAEEEEGHERWRHRCGNEGLVTASDLTQILSLSSLPLHGLASLALLSLELFRRWDPPADAV